MTNNKCCSDVHPHCRAASQPCLTGLLWCVRTQVGLLLGFLASVAVLGLVLPGKTVPGVLLPDNTRILYKSNGESRFVEARPISQSVSQSCVMMPWFWRCASGLTLCSNGTGFNVLLALVSTLTVAAKTGFIDPTVRFWNRAHTC